jgi:transposase
LDKIPFKTCPELDLGTEGRKGMIKMEDWLTIRNLRERGYLIKRIARELKISRNTVKRALRKEPPPRYCRPPRVNSKIEPFHEAIAQMLLKDLIGTRIFKKS